MAGVVDREETTGVVVGSVLCGADVGKIAAIGALRAAIVASNVNGSMGLQAVRTNIARKIVRMKVFLPWGMPDSQGIKVVHLYA